MLAAQPVLCVLGGGTGGRSPPARPGPSVDSAIAQLTGALAVPVWVAMPLAPDWRWLLDREDTPWYPTMKLFRQRRPNDWVEVISRMAAQLQILGGTIDRGTGHPTRGGSSGMHVKDGRWSFKGVAFGVAKANALLTGSPIATRESESSQARPT